MQIDFEEVRTLLSPVSIKQSEVMNLRTGRGIFTFSRGERSYRNLVFVVGSNATLSGAVDAVDFPAIKLE